MSHRVFRYSVVRSLFARWNVVERSIHKLTITPITLILVSARGAKLYRTIEFECRQCNKMVLTAGAIA